MYMNPTVSVRLVRTSGQLVEIGRVRSRAYSKHVHNVHADDSGLDSQDQDSKTISIYCEDKTSKKTLGALRISIADDEFLPIQKAFLLPTEMLGTRIAEITRLAMPASPNSKFIKALLFKALFQYCVAMQVKWMIVGARSPLDLEYLSLNFTDLTKSAGYVPIQHAWGLPHKVLAFEVMTAERRWHSLEHPLYDFVFKETHKEIEVFNSVTPMWERPRSGDSASAWINPSGESNRLS
jgi:hypothetical protein